MTPENCAALAQLCHTLDGIPLAVELAAARLPPLSVQQVLDRLQDRFKLLTTGNRAASPRQQTLSALIGWSFDLCSADEQLLWTRLSIFPGSFHVPAVERLSIIASLQGDFAHAASFSQECLALCDTYGERWYKSYTLCDLGIALWQQGDVHQAAIVERESLRLSRSFNQKLGIGMSIEVLAWIAVTDGHCERAARLFGALQEIWRVIGVPPSGLGHLASYHDQCVAEAYETLGERKFEKARVIGAELDLDGVVAYALEEDQPAPDRPKAGTPLTCPEQEVAELLGAGKTNKEIAATLMIAQRTAESHVANILIKLGFTTRTQIAAWGADRRAHQGSPRTTGITRR